MQAAFSKISKFEDFLKKTTQQQTTVIGYFQTGKHLLVL